MTTVLNHPTPERPRPVILLPGSVLPAELAYARLLAEFGTEIDARPKELEVYAHDRPPADYSLATEVDGITRVADEAGFARFHLVGYSGGGAASLAFTARFPERVASLALMEPAFAGWQGMTPEERALMERFRALLVMDGPEQMARFQTLQLAPGVQPPSPPPEPAPAWMAQRPAGVRAFLATFFSSDMDLDSLRKFEQPVWFALGGRSNPDYFGRMADRLARVFPNFTIELFSDRHHFDPPQRAEPGRVAASLTGLWTRADSTRPPR